MILDPYHMDVIEWTDKMSSFYIVGNSTTMTLMDPENWREWVINLLGNPDPIGQDAPNPYDYDDWRKWAAAFFLSQELF